MQMEMLLSSAVCHNEQEMLPIPDFLRRQVDGPAPKRPKRRPKKWSWGRKMPKPDPELVRIHLGDQAPRIGSGWRSVKVTTYGRKWVHVVYDEIGGHPVRHKFLKAEWERITA